jgi:hypothetical protein
VARLLDLHELIAAPVPPDHQPPVPPELALAPEEADACRLDRLLLDRVREGRRRDAGPAAIPALLDQAVELAERVPGWRGPHLLTELYNDRADQLEAAGDLAYRSALEDLAAQHEAGAGGA